MKGNTMTTTVALEAKPTKLPAPARRPYSIDVCENSFKAFQIASALCRQGYVILKDRPVDIYTNGVAVFTMVLGEADETGYADAEEAMRKALDKEQAEFEARVEREVLVRIEAIKRAEHEAKIAQQKAEHQQKIKELEAAAAAEIARLDAEAAARLAKL
jgi:plasmid maintenance system killer protein